MYYSSLASPLSDEHFDHLRRMIYSSLFEELGEKHVREDAYGGPYGVAIGGEFIGMKYEFAVQYLDAADLLLIAIKNQTVEDFTLGNPIVFLYRHSIELLLKSQLGNPRKRHDLRGLYAAFANQIKARYGVRIPRWIRLRVFEFADIDPKSTFFRYPPDVGETMPPLLNRTEGELHTYLFQLKEVSHALHSAVCDAPHFRPYLPIYRGPNPSSD